MNPEELRLACLREATELYRNLQIDKYEVLTRANQFWKFVQGGDLEKAEKADEIPF